MASIHGTVSTILAVQSSAPCSPCMNCDSSQFWFSTPNCRNRFSSHFSSTVPAMAASSNLHLAGLASALAMTTRSWSTSMDQSRSVWPFHCAFLAFS